MGYYITDHEPAVKKPRQKADPPSKKRVWKNFSTTRPRTGFFASQPVEPHWEKQPTPTTTASGVLYYGYRFYSPELGRWLSRDPAGKIGGLNIYSFVLNNSVNGVDLLGLKYYGLPATPEKCEKVGEIMAVSATLAGPVSYSLWMHWLSGTGDPMELSMSSFDFLGTCRRAAKRRISDMQNSFIESGQGLSCSGSTTESDSISEACVSVNMMILNYDLTAAYEASISKSCDDAGCCESIDVDVDIDFSASDRTDFNPGATFPAFPWHTIEDDLINACFEFGDNDFDISAESSSSMSFSGDCD